MSKAKAMSIIKKNNCNLFQIHNLLTEEFGAVSVYDASVNTEKFRLSNGEVISINMQTKEVS